MTGIIGRDKTWKKSVCTLTGKQLNKNGNIHRLKNYAINKKKKLGLCQITQKDSCKVYFSDKI